MQSLGFRVPQSFKVIAVLVVSLGFGVWDSLV